MTGFGYAGDITPEDAWQKLESDESAQLIDCRTVPEWQFVGVPDLHHLGKETILVDWQVYPQMAVRGDFADHINHRIPDKDATVLVLCRSGVRSIAAAQALTQAGYQNAYNVLDGFEGQLDAAGHRGAGGWKAAGLPWRQ